ncbi:MAG: hypothetical protein SGJ02_00010 [bacterium]|nr:hypothetical protein [bacterium]
MTIRVSKFLFILILLLPVQSQGIDVTGSEAENFFAESKDADKSANELLDEATDLLSQDRPLDARTKLLKALDKDPKNYKIHMLLGGYYLIHVDHYRLAIQYLKQSKTLFEAQNGAPPYEDLILKDDHSKILYLLSETRLNLDNYQGALDTLDEYSKYYYGSWYPGSRAWILMKLGHVDEAVRIARLGILTGAEPGRTLNILGILLSMTGQRESSIKIFEEAINYEYAIGDSGQPATPLNNVGEVYREIFDEERAEGSWLKATSMPDGCEHVLPSLNLTNLYIEQLKFDKAKSRMDNFEQCVLQYPLRSGEEHKALVHLARGRIALHTGHIEDAIKHLESASQRQQWFGKIGTDVNDLRAATLVSLAQALEARINKLKHTKFENFKDWTVSLKEITSNKIRSWWYFRRARQVLAEDLSDFEDLYIRNTDSLIEYHTLGDLLEAVPTRIIEKRIINEISKDDREGAKTYYQAYLAQNYLSGFQKNKGLKVLAETLNAARKGADSGLRVHLLGLKLKSLKITDPSYLTYATELFSLAPAEFKNKGLKLPVKLGNLSSELENIITNSNFTVNSASPYELREEDNRRDAKGKFSLTFIGTEKTLRESGDTAAKTLNLINDLVFRVDLN